MTAAALHPNSQPHPSTPAQAPSAIVKNPLRELCAASPWLTATGFVMLADTAVSLLGLALDPTFITGAPAWLKPLKFAISTGLFAFTVAWMIGKLNKTRRFAAIFGRFLAVALTLEIVLIDMQAARHTTSHFNYATRFDAGVFGAMGVGIGVVLVSTVLLLVAACLERFSDRALGWSIRLSLLLALAGMGVGSLMTLPTPEQLATAHAGVPMHRVGAHTVGAPDGGPSLPITGWSADHGDLRIAHFLGLHAMQVLLLTWWFAPRKRPTAWVVLAAICWAIAFSIVLAQALRGQPLLRPDTAILASWVAWLILTVCGAVSLYFASRNPTQEHA